MRYFIVVPRAAARVSNLKDKIDSALKTHGAVRRRICKRLGTVTFAMENNSFDAFSALCRDLEGIHAGIFATSYKKGRKIQ